MDVNCVQILSSKLLLNGYASSLIGGRPENQDDMIWADTPLGFLLMVCDGMGGGPGGSTASYLVKSTVMQTIQECPEHADRKSALKRAVSNANDVLNNKMDQVPSLRGMGSTLVAILINAQSAVIAHLGDSRCYRLHGDSVLFRTLDHSLVSELVRNKVMTEEQARTSPQSNVITRGLGSTSNHVAEIEEVPFKKGDRFVLCSDGVWGAMPHPTFIKRIGNNLDVHAVVDNLQMEIDRLGTERGGHFDNHTLAIIEMNMDSIMKDKMSKQLKIILGTLSALLLVSIIFNIVCIVKMGNAPQKEEFERLMKENAELLRRGDIMKDFYNDKDGDRYLQMIQLTNQNEFLKQEVAYLNAEVDSLKQVLVKSETESKGKIENEKKEQQKNVERREPLTSKEFGQQILKQYEQLKNVREKKQSDVIKIVEECRDSISNDLEKLGRMCKNPGKTDYIKSLLPTNEIIEGSISRSYNQHGLLYFYPNPPLIRKFENSQKKLHELINDLK